MGKLVLKNQTTPSTPSSGYTSLYIDTSDKHLKSKDDAGTVIDYTAAISGDYILSTQNSTPAYSLLVKTATDDHVEHFSDNSVSSIPNGIFGIGTTKPNATSIIVVTEGEITGGFVGLTTGAAYFVSTSGGLTLTPPATGVVQQVGFALNATDFYVQIKQPMVRS